MEKIFIWEQNLARIFGQINSKILDYFFIFISYLGELAFCWWVAAFLVLFLDKKQGKRVFVLFLILVLIHLVVVDLIFRYTWYRPRPFVIFPEIEKIASFWNNGSFPSGHVTMAVAAGILFGKFYKKFIIPIIIFIILTAFSRLWLGMHYLTDVLVGAGLGVIFGYFVLYLNKRWFKKVLK